MLSVHTAQTNLSPTERQARFQQIAGAGTARNGSRGGISGGFAAGEIIAKDNTSVTVKLSDGGSKIIFFNQNTPITKSVGGSVADLKIGEQIIAQGTANQDGSLSSQSIQLRPAAPTKILN
jgi:hypothetical protein